MLLPLTIVAIKKKHYDKFRSSNQIRYSRVLQVGVFYSMMNNHPVCRREFFREKKEIIYSYSKIVDRGVEKETA